MSEATKDDMPKKTRVYSTHQFNSERWNGIKLRDDDIIISSVVKSGSTWSLRIVGLLVFKDLEKIDAEVMEGPWPDCAFDGPAEAVVEMAESIQGRRRFFRSHMPLDGLPYNPNVKYVHIVRDPRDAFMSLQHHWSKINDAQYERLQEYWGEPFPRPDEVGDIHERWRRWMTEGRHEWEQDGWPFQSAFHFAESFWQYRHMPNILLCHYNDYKTDLEGEMKRVAKFIGEEIPEDQWPAFVEAAGFSSMKKNLDKMMTLYNKTFDGGANGFMNKGTNSRWKDIFNDEDHALYEQRASKLDPELRKWLENGRLVAGNPQKF